MATTASAQPSTAATPPVRLSRAFIGSVLGGGIAGVVNIGLYFLGRSLGADFKTNDPAMPMLLWFQGFVFSLIAGVVGFVIFAVLVKVAKQRAWPIFLGISAVVFAVYLYFPFTVFADMTTIAILELMHIPTTAFILLGLHRFGRRAP